MNLLLLDFNNYFNRTIVKYSSVADYRTNATNYDIVMAVNFIPNDGVNTEQVINFNKDWEVNYVVCFDENNVIKSRWFVIESVRLRNGQFRLSLKRDSIVDNFNAVITAPCFIEKATIKNTSDIAIYNTEGMQFNQIKQNQTLLTDGLSCGWLVGYVAQNYAGTATMTIPGATISNRIVASSRSSWEYNDFITTPWKYVETKAMKIGTWMSPDIYGLSAKKCFYNVGGDYYFEATLGNQPNAWLKVIANDFQAQLFSNYVNGLAETIWSAYFGTQTSASGYKNTNPIPLLDGKYIYFTDENKLYQISVSYGSGTYSGWQTINSSVESAVNNCLTGYQTNLYAYPNSATALPEANVYLSFAYKTSQITLTEVTTGAFTLTNFMTSSNILIDAPYKMFAIPYASTSVNDTDSTRFNTLSRKQALLVASTIATTLSTNIYDVQILPYCPIREMVDSSNNRIDISNGYVEGTDFTYIKDGSSNKKGIVIYPKYSSFSFDISKTFTAPSGVVDFKLANEQQFYRIMSPNGASQFDFKVTKTGTFSTINVDCTYKPYSPYIHINPSWRGLYGIDYDDYRGLICQGDFSMPIVNDQWQTYQINNKNYLNAFNRETDSLETQYSYQRAMNITSSIAGSFGAGASGAMTGGLIGSSNLAKGLGVGAGVASLAGGIADVAISDRIHQEQMDLRQDQFNYNMQNIAARPNTLAKTSAFDYNNKIYPYIEEYNASSQEQQILKDKMTYEGMTIMKISNIANYLSSSQTYIRGNLIMLENIEGDYHMIDDIKKEISLGLRIKE